MAESTKPLEYDPKEKKEIIDALNQDLAREYMSIIQYIQYSASVTGPYRQELANFFRNEISDEVLHAQYLADKIAALGGVPTVEPAPVKQSTEAREMLQNVMDAENEQRRAYIEHAELAEKHGDIGLVNRLEDFTDDETHHMEETEKLLRGWR